MVHAMCNDVDDGAAVWFLSRRVVQVVDETFVEAILTNCASADCGQVAGDGIETPEQAIHRAACRLIVFILADGLAADQIGLDFHVADDVQQRGPDRAMGDVELAIQLLVGQFAATQQQLLRGPGIVAEQAIENIHEQ
jgi:hypothetical protein